MCVLLKKNAASKSKIPNFKHRPSYDETQIILIYTISIYTIVQFIWMSTFQKLTFINIWA